MKRVIVPVLTILFLAFGSMAQAFIPQTDTTNQNDTTTDEIARVYGPQGEYVGSIKNALLSPLGKIEFLILSLGNPKAEGGKEVIVPVTVFSYDEEQGRITSNVSKEALARAPEFRPKDMEDPQFAERIYRFYGQTPSWIDRSSEGSEKQQEFTF
jgi:hypothetical protein